MALEDVTRFWKWFDETRGASSIRQIEERAHCPRGRIGNAYSAKKEPTALVCTSIAEGLRLDRDEVFRQARLLRPEPPETSRRREADYLFTHLTSEDQETVLIQMRALAERRVPYETATQSP